MRFEANLEDHQPRVISGVKGLKSRPFQKKFKNQAAMERWFESEAASDCDIYEVRGV